MGEMKLPDIRLDGKIVIVTGADRGLGRAMSIALARVGATAVLASPDEQGLEAVASEIEALGTCRAIVMAADITNFQSCRSLVRATLERTGRLDVLVNNARRLTRGPGLASDANALPFQDVDPDFYRESVMVNVTGAFFMSRAAVEHFLLQRKGKIVNITTSRWHAYRPHNAPYGVTKAALEASTLIWSRDLDGTGITVNSLLPGGAVDTEPDRPKLPGASLLPVDIMNPLIVWLASDHSDGVTGCRFVGKMWDASLPPDKAAKATREEPVFQGQPLGTFPLHSCS